MIEVAPSARPRMQARPSRPDPMITQLLFWGLLGAAAYLLYIHILLSFINYDRDENMYLGASYFVFHGMTIYRDFLYFQTPYLPYLYALIGGLLAGEDYYMAGKACSILFYAGTIVVCASYIYRQSASKILALSMVVLLLINPVMAKVGQVASNYILATFLSALSFLIYLRAISSKKNYIYFFVGALVGVSAGIKLYHITLIIPYAASFLIGSDNNASEKRGFFWLLAGFLFSLSPVFFLYFLYPESFLYSNLEYHWLAKGVFAIGMDGFIKSKIILRYFFNPSMLILAVCSTAAIFYLLLRWKEVRKEQFVAAAATATALATVVLPTPPHSEYLSYPIVLMCFLVGSCINKFHDFMVVKIFIIATMLSLVIHFYQKSSVLLSPHGIQAYKNAVEPYAKKMVALAQKYDLREGVASFTPLTVLEAGLPIMTDFSGGVFNQICAPFLSEEQRKKFVCGKDELFKSLESKRPALIQVGLEAQDRWLREFAEAHGYLPLDSEFYLRADLQHHQALE